MSRTRFHYVCGSNVRLSSDGVTAKLMKAGHGVEIVFTAKPLIRNEKVCLMVTLPTGGSCSDLIFGFTNENPITLLEDERRLAWKPYLALKKFENNRILHICVYPSGEVHFGYNNEYSSDYFSGVDISRLWFFIHLPCVGSEVKLVEPRVSPLLLRGDMKNLRPLIFDINNGKLIESRPYNTSKSLNGIWMQLTDGYVFSASPIEVNQKVCFHTISEGKLPTIIHVGFINHDTSYDTQSVKRNWSTKERVMLLRKYHFIYFYVNPTGDVYFSIDGSKEYKLFSGVDTTVPFRATFDNFNEESETILATTNAVSAYIRYYYAQLKDNSNSIYTRPVTDIRPKTTRHVAQSLSQPASSIAPSAPDSTMQLALSTSQSTSQVASSVVQPTSSIDPSAPDSTRQLAPYTSQYTSQVVSSKIKSTISRVQSAPHPTSQIASVASQRTSLVIQSKLQLASSIATSALQPSSQVAPNVLQPESSIATYVPQSTDQVAPTASQRTSLIVQSSLQSTSSIASSTALQLTSHVTIFFSSDCQ